MIVSSLFRRFVFMSLDEPLLVVCITKLKECETQLFDGAEVFYPEEVFLRRADESLRTSIAFWFADEARRCLYAEECDLVLEVVRDIL